MKHSDLGVEITSLGVESDSKMKMKVAMGSLSENLRMSSGVPESMKRGKSNPSDVK